ncbi:DEAD/DEAH box helicase [Methanoregula sp.]|uniref:DEAD/DEAH box helicase n=1 Tax=Methanoregula sp. TaxID=2052170 RepID=UPI00236FA945|nr:DEAD/DEAH box helicase [Methanoregula sp.]MDD1687658.1 DEAD/DEAH box helicase [Methanoregula sp.]
MAVNDLIRLLEVNPVYRTRVVHVRSIEPKPARVGSLELPLSPSLAAYLDQMGIRLYSHQCEAINHVRAGKNVILTTSTASGKTLAFNIPVYSNLEINKDARALYLYPTKALSNDQLLSLDQMAKFTGIAVKPALYDGDTPQSKRAAIREHSRIIISNPHELHQVLSWHAKWQPFLSNLQFIVIDEAHRYRGVFGSHIAFVIRRLLRLCRHYGSDPRFVLSTATLANPREFAHHLTGQEFELVDNDGSPHGRKNFVLYNPFYDGISERSMHQETKDLLVSCVKENLQTLCFTGSRKMAELVTVWARDDVRRLSPGLADSISAYRAGFLPEERRAIERQLKGGTLKGVVSTNALELGIDVGSLDAVIISGYPGTMMSTRQQAGRAGRKGDESLAILVAQANPLDQYFMHHPDQFFDRSHEHAIVDTANPYILSGHLLCAAAELPLNEETDREFFGEPVSGFLSELASDDLLRRTSRGWVYTGRGRAAEAVRLDGVPGETFRIMCHGRLLETLDRGQAYREAHKGAIMLHQGETFVVNEMDLETHTIRVTETDVDYYTQPQKEVDLSIIETLETRTVNGIKCAYGEVDVTEQYTGYKIKRGDTIIGMEPLSLPALTFRTKAFWFIPPDSVEHKVTDAGLDLAGGLHGAEHAIIGLMPLHVMCDRWDIGGLSSPVFGETGEPVVFVYDGYEGGIGLAEKAFGILPALFTSAYELVRDCPCESGCPSCIYSPKCGNDNQPLDKEATILILGELCREPEKNGSCHPCPTGLKITAP